MTPRAKQLAKQLRHKGHGDLARRVEAQSFPWHLGGQADDAALDTYKGLVAIRNALNNVPHPPEDWKPLYREVADAIKAAGQARAATTQVRETLKKLAADR